MGKKQHSCRHQFFLVGDTMMSLVLQMCSGQFNVILAFEVRVFAVLDKRG